MSVECVVPFAGDCPHRQRAWEWVRERLPYPIRFGSCDGEWCKALAVMPAIEASEAETIVVHDADVWCQALPEAVRAVQEGAPWAIPHRSVVRLTEEASRAFMDGTPVEALTPSERVTMGVEGGGIFVTRRETLLEIPFDPRFVGWGQEDSAIGKALTCLAGHRWRPTGYSPLVHLWHPPQPRLDRKYGSLEGRRLIKRYQAAKDDPTAMRRLIEEAVCSPA